MSVLDKYRRTIYTGKQVVPIKKKESPEKKGVINSAFDKESYVDKFRRGDIKGGVANLAMSPLRALHSGYLNLLNVPHAMYHGEKPKFTHNMDYSDFESEVARRGGVAPVSERIDAVHPMLGSAYKLGMEIGTDPIELTPLGFLKDIQRAKAGSQATRGYMEALQAGKLVPKGAAVKSVSKPQVTRRSLAPVKQSTPSVGKGLGATDSITPIATKTPSTKGVTVEVSVGKQTQSIPYKTMDEAKVAVKDLKSQGFESKIVGAETVAETSKDYVVSINIGNRVQKTAYNTLKDAQGAVKDLKAQGFNANIISPTVPVKTAKKVIPTKTVKAVRPKPKIDHTIGNADTAARKIVYGKPTAKPSSFKEITQRMRKVAVDELAYIHDAEIDIRGVKSTKLGTKQLPSAEKSLYKTMRLTRGSPESAIMRIKDKLEPIVRNFEKAGGNSKELGLYAEAIHARDVNKAGINSGFTNAEIADVIKKYGTKEAEQARKALVQYSRELLEDLVKAGRLSQKEFNAMTAKWKNYMPLNRVMDSGDTFDTIVRRAMSDADKPVKALKGSDRRIVDPIASLVRNTYLTESSIAKGKVGKQVAEFAKADTASKYIRRMGLKESEKGKNIIKTLEKGKEVSYEVSPEIYKAFTGIEQEATNTVVKILQQPTSVLRAGAILNPEFATKNFMRDINQAFINSESGFNPITDFVRGMYSFLKKDDLYREFVKEGGAFGVMVDIDRNAFKQSQKMIMTKTTRDKFLNAINPQTWLEGLRNLSEVSEMSTRVGEYKAALRKGATKAEAAYRARDLQDYFRKGTKTGNINKIVAFFNANIQGKSKFLRSIQRDPVGVGSRLLGIMAVPSISAYGYNHLLANEEQKRRIKDAPQWEKDAFRLFAIPGTDQVLRFPKPFEGAPVSMLIERGLDFLIAKDEKAFDTLTRDLIRDQAIPIMPTAILPLVEAMANHSFFMDMPVVPTRLENLELQDQQDFRTSIVAKGAAKGVRAVAGDKFKLGSPARVQHVIKGYTGGLGTYATDIIDILTGQNLKPTPGLTQMPGVKSIMMNPHTSGKSSEYIYEESERLLKAKNSRPSEFKEEPQRRYLEYVKREMSDYSKQIRDVQNSTVLTGKQKREKLDTLYRKRNRLSYKAVQDYEEVAKVAETLSRRIKDDDELVRAVNRKVFGTKEALKRYNKAIYQKALKTTKGNITYDVYYDLYFATQGIESDKYNGETIAAGSKEERRGEGQSKSLKIKKEIDKIKRLSDADKEILYDAFNVAMSVRRKLIVPIKT